MQSDGMSAPYLASGFGIMMTTGAAAGYAAFILGAAMIRPASIRLGAIARSLQTAGAPPSADLAAEIASLQRRMRVGGRIVAVILGVCVACMATARYVTF
jgi:hypothetical protein